MIYQEQTGNFLYVSSYDERGEIFIDRIPIGAKDQFSWVECDENDPQRVPGYMSQNWMPVKKMAGRFLNKYRKMEFINSLSSEVRDRIFNSNMPNIFSVDIETEMIEGEELDEDNPKGKVLSVAFCDTTGNVMVATIKEFSDKQKESIQKRLTEYFKDLENGLIKEWKIRVKVYSSEPQMLADLFYNYFTKMPLITGWNFLKFDMRYMVNRCKILGINYKKMSPTGNFYNYTITDKFDRTIKYKVELPAHRGVVDYMTYFEKWDTALKIKSSMNLDDIAGELLKVKKYHYNGTLMELYRDDHESFLLYNCIDTILVALIHMKVNTFSTAIGLSKEGRVALHEVLHASIICENLFSNYFLNNRGKMEKVVFVNKGERPEEGKYSGGYVEEPQTGIKNDVMIVDYESEFPSIMMSSNIGIDTLIGHTMDNGQTYTDRKTGEVLPLDPERHIWTSQKTVFTKEYDSSCRTIVAGLFDGRVANKNAVSDIEEEIKYLSELVKSK